jgi:hypothetical protein
VTAVATERWAAAREGSRLFHLVACGPPEIQSACGVSMSLLAVHRTIRDWMPPRYAERCTPCARTQLT